MAHKKAAGTAKNGRDSRSKRRGVKKFGGQLCLAGNIIVRQKGTVYVPGENVALGNDYTLYATTPGKVKFTEKRVKKYDGRIFRKTVVNVEIA